MNRQVHELWCTAPPLNHSTNKLSYLKHTNLQGEQRQRLPRPCTHLPSAFPAPGTILPSEQCQRLRAPLTAAHIMYFFVQYIDIFMHLPYNIYIIKRGDYYGKINNK